MGTKSHIAIERENGAVESIRCQYDGYPAYMKIVKSKATPKSLPKKSPKVPKLP